MCLVIRSLGIGVLIGIPILAPRVLDGIPRYPWWCPRQVVPLGTLGPLWDLHGTPSEITSEMALGISSGIFWKVSGDLVILVYKARSFGIQGSTDFILHCSFRLIIFYSVNFIVKPYFSVTGIIVICFTTNTRITLD